MAFFYYLCIVLVFSGDVQAAMSNKTVEGHSASYVGECIGSMKPVTISKDHQKFIEIYVFGINSAPREKRKYNYDTVELMANDDNMDWSRPILFYISGWIENVHVPVVNNAPAIQAAYRRRGYNVWILNAVKLMPYRFPVAARAVSALGDYVGEMIANLTVIQPKFDHKKLELLGLGLGGQTMSFIAKSFTKRTGLKLPKLTALDPAGPCFRNRGPESRIDDSDADFVELIMTNAARFSMTAPAGHVNFYVNGGDFQLGYLHWMVCGSVCSHKRATSIWLTALKYPNSFIAIKCDSVEEARNKKCYDKTPLITNVLGPKVDKNKTGVFYLSVRQYYPYYLGENGLNKEYDYVVGQLSRANANDVLTF